MKQAYGNYYKIFGCARKKCGCEESSACEAKAEAAETTCEDIKNKYCFEAADCNDCIIERTGLADAYVPYQPEFDVMAPEKSLICGTVFQSLAMPYKKSGCVQKGGKA